MTQNLTFSLAQTSHPSASLVLARITPLLMTQEGAGGSQVAIVVGFVGGDLADVHSSGTWLLNLRIPSIFQDELIKKLQVPLQGENVSLRPLVSILQRSKNLKRRCGLQRTPRELVVKSEPELRSPRIPLL